MDIVDVVRTIVLVPAWVLESSVIGIVAEIVVDVVGREGIGAVSVTTVGEVEMVVVVVAVDVAVVVVVVAVAVVVVMVVVV